MKNNLLASISILIKDRKNNSAPINQILTNNGNLIMARLGVNIQKKCIENCQAMIVIIARGKEIEIKTLEKKLQETGVIVKTNIFEE